MMSKNKGKKKQQRTILLIIFEVINTYKIELQALSSELNISLNTLKRWEDDKTIKPSALSDDKKLSVLLDVISEEIESDLDLIKTHKLIDRSKNIIMNSIPSKNIKDKRRRKDRLLQETIPFTFFEMVFDELIGSDWVIDYSVLLEISTDQKGARSKMFEQYSLILMGLLQMRKLMRQVG